MLKFFSGRNSRGQSGAFISHPVIFCCCIYSSIWSNFSAGNTNLSILCFPQLYLLLTEHHHTRCFFYKNKFIRTQAFGHPEIKNMIRTQGFPQQ